MIDYIFLILLIPILLIYPFLITYIINKHTKKSKDITIKTIVIETVKIILFSMITFIIICLLIEKYYDLIIPINNNGTCVNTGGWTYSCIGDYRTITLLGVMGIIITIHHFLSQLSIYKICKFNNKYLSYIYMYIYLIIIYILNFAFILFIYGFIASIHFDSIIMEIIRFIIGTLPTSLFIISTLIYALKNKH